MNPKLNKILRITVAWTLVSIIHYLVGLVSLLDYDYDFTKRDPVVGFYASLITGILAGLIGGVMLVFGWEKWLRSQPYGIALRNIILSYVAIFYLVGIPTSLFYNLNFSSLKINEPALWLEVLGALTSPSLLVTFVFWLIVIALTMIAFLVDDKYGPGVFRKFLLGKYFTPSKEERIFMFLDLKSSTTIAERLGEEQYFSFLKETFKAITPAIIKHKAEVSVCR